MTSKISDINLNGRGMALPCPSPTDVTHPWGHGNAMSLPNRCDTSYGGMAVPCPYQTIGAL